jgi:hypothetical protein
MPEVGSRPHASHIPRAKPGLGSIRCWREADEDKAHISREAKPRQSTGTILRARVNVNINGRPAGSKIVLPLFHVEVYHHGLLALPHSPARKGSQL